MNSHRIIKKIIGRTLLACSPTLLFAQNMVLNPSFEDIAPGQSITLNSPIEAAANWNAPNEGKSLLYTTSGGYVYDPNGASWPFKARSGRNVAGMNVYGEDIYGEPRREYIQGTLSKPLTEGKKYRFEFWVHYHCEGANNIGIVFLPEKIKSTSKGLLQFKPNSYQKKVTPYDNGKDTWTLVRDTFVAARAFKSFIIGNFFPDSLTEIEDNGYGHHFAYIDDIMVVELNDAPEAQITEAEKKDWDKNVEMSEGMSVESKGIGTNTNLVYFKFASSSILPESEALLNEIAANWAQYPNAKIALNGFASSEGSHAYNKRLSIRRNQSVSKYLISKGVSGSNISTTAFGEGNPAAPNDTEENRSKNRRVEIVLKAE